MEQQLILSEKELVKIGFIEKQVSREDFEGVKSSMSIFTIDTINGCFIYNVTEDIYRWYHKTIIGKHCNDVHLDITTKPQLLLILQTFRVKIAFWQADKHLN